MFQRRQQAVVGGGDKRYGDALPIKSSGLLIVFFTTSASEFPVLTPARRLQSAPVGWLQPQRAGTEVADLHVA